LNKLVRSKSNALLTLIYHPKIISSKADKQQIIDDHPDQLGTMTFNLFSQKRKPLARAGGLKRW
jgi:hypothetical protein